MRVFLQFEKRPLFFHNPKYIVTCYNPLFFTSSIREIEHAVECGYYAAGFISYEAGYCFENRRQENKSYDFPLMCMGIFEAPSAPAFRIDSSRSVLKNFRLNISRERYFTNINRIREYIRQGDIYQLTYCIKLLFRFEGDPFSLFTSLLSAQPVPYPAYIETGDCTILSLSPEMFIKKNSASIVTKPMKGTWPRGNTVISDFFSRVRFQFDEKNRAENLMITDLLRNDLGRIGSNIKVPKLFEVARYKTLYQMTSTVTGAVDKNISLYNLFASLFPSGSVTGAPKIRAMEIVQELEDEERHIYTGAIGYIAPGKNLFFNIPIRTLLLKGNSGEMGIGGGIVWDSTPEGEWEEGMLKARFILRQE